MGAMTPTGASLGNPELVICYGDRVQVQPTHLANKSEVWKRDERHFGRQSPSESRKGNKDAEVPPLVATTPPIKTNDLHSANIPYHKLSGCIYKMYSIIHYGF